MTEENPPIAPVPTEEGQDSETLDIQLGGHVIDDEENGAVYTAFARIPDPAEEEVGSLDPIAEIRLTFHEDIAGPAVASLFQVFVNEVDGLVQRIDEARPQEGPAIVEGEGDVDVETKLAEASE